MNKLKLFIGVGICGVLFSGCGFFTEWGEDIKDIWSGKTGTGCVPVDFRERVAKYQEQYKNDDDMFPKVANMHNTSMFNQQKTFNSYSPKRSKYMDKAYDEIIKEDGAPKSYDEEVKFLDKVQKRFTRLFKLDNPNNAYECEFDKCERKNKY